MKISLNWLRDYAVLPEDTTVIADLLTSLGLEVEGIDTIGAAALDFEGLVVGKVLECGKHPEADRLSLTLVDVGTDTPLHIVCGAPNVATGQKVAVATQGAKVMGKDGEVFTIKKGKIRGAASEGMLCALDELGLGSDHSGIWVLPETAEIGQPLRQLITLDTDEVFSIGLTPNRADAMCHIGVARDLMAALQVREGLPSTLQLPDTSAFPALTNSSLPIDITISDPALCSRYAGVVLDNITVGPSPDWVQKRLQTIGLRSINNVVDATNYVMLEMGQPLHAFDYDAIGSPAAISVRCKEADTVFETLDAQQIKLHSEDIMICGAQAQPMCIAGVFGGLSSGVSDKTTRIFLESAVFNATAVRKSSQRHGLRTESATRFEKGVDSNVTIIALQRCALLIADWAGGQIVSPVYDFYPEVKANAQVAMSYSGLSAAIGMDMPKQHVQKIFAALNFDLLIDSDDDFTVAIPTAKPDVTRKADVVEEVLRVHGYDNVPMPGKISFTPGTQAKSGTDYAKSIAQLLNGHGFHEAMNMSLTDANYLGVEDESVVRILNTANRNLDAMRPSMVYGLLESAARNVNRKQNDVRLFEFGNTYLRKESGKYVESARLAILCRGERFEESWRRPNALATDIYELKSVVQSLLSRLGIATWQEQSVAAHSELDMALSLQLGPNQVLGYIGKVKTSLCKRLDIKGDTYFADLDWSILTRLARQQRFVFTEISRFPSVSRDLAIMLKKDTKFAAVEMVVRKAGKPLLRTVRLFDVFEDESKLGPGLKSYALNFKFESLDQTLSDKEIDGAMLNIERSLEKQLDAVVRR